MQDGAEHSCRCNEQISLVICFNPLSIHNRTVGQKIKLTPSSLWLPLKTKQSFLLTHIKTEVCEGEISQGLTGNTQEKSD